MDDFKIEEPLVTVIVPAYNHELYIEECLRSVICQTYSNLEIIVINDGSKDKTDDVIKNFLKTQKTHIEYINKNNEGLCKTLNMGIGLAKGEYITFIASDDVWLPNRIEQQILIMQNNKNVGLVCTDAYFMRGTNPTTLRYSDYKPKVKKLFLNSIQNTNMYEEMLVDNIILALTVLVKKECFNKVGLFDESLKYEDYDMWLRICKVYPIAYIDIPLAYYRTHENNASNNTKMMLIGALQAISKQYKSTKLINKPFKKCKLFVKFLLNVLKNRVTKNLKVKRDSNVD